MMGQTDPRSREALDARETRKTWVERYLGEGWTELEPGIYRYDANGGGADPPDAPGRFDERHYGESGMRGSPDPRRNDSERADSRR